MTKILVIEDEPDVREIILDILHEEEYGVTGAENGRIGIQLAIENLPDLIICDIMMPDLDGYDVLKQLRENTVTSTIPFIFLTAKATRSHVRQGMNLGADDYLTKPFTRHELLSTISSRIQKQAIVEQKTQEKLDELRGNITLSLPHQLRTPLNGILGLSQLLIEDFQDMDVKEVRESLVDINTSAKRLYKLVSNFLLYADLEILDHEPGKLKSLLKGTVNHPTSVIQNTVQKLLESYPDREADLTLHLNHYHPISISEEIFQKILQELLDNALKFSQVGTPIQMSSQAVPSGYDLEILDRGEGMTNEQLTHLGIDQQFNRSRYEQQGLGLGLMIVKRLVELQGGELSIKSILKQGTIVQIYIPFVSSS